VVLQEDWKDEPLSMHRHSHGWVGSGQ
jgi:hypothetical protein